MERRIMGNQEKEQRQQDDIRDLVVKELEAQRNAALEMIEQQQAIAATAQDKIDAIHNVIGNPITILEIDYLDVEYDTYTYSEYVTKTEQFAMSEASIERTLNACANLLNGNKETRLSKMAIEVTVNQQLILVPLQEITEWQRRLMAQVDSNTVT
jgi:hypothetical protein